MIVDGEVLMENRFVIDVDEGEVLELAQEQIEGAVGRRGLKNLFEITEVYCGKSRYLL